MKKKKLPTKAALFSGEGSASLWDEINRANSVAKLRKALYNVCARLQELEQKILESK